MDGDLELIYEDSNSRASCLSTASTECGSPSQVTSCTPQSLLGHSPSEPSSVEVGSPSSSSRAAASAHAPFSLETTPASQRSTAVYPFAAVKPDGWEETAAYDEQNELHRDVLELLFDLILSSRASVKTGSIDSAAKPDALVKSATSGSSAPPVSFFRIRGAAAKQLLSHLLPGSQDEPSSLKPAPSAPVHENMLQTLVNPSIETVVKNVWLACFGSPVGLRKKCPSEVMKMLFSAPRGSRAVLSISTERRGNLQQMLTSWIAPRRRRLEQRQQPAADRPRVPLTAPKRTNYKITDGPYKGWTGKQLHEQARRIATEQGETVASLGLSKVTQTMSKQEAHEWLLAFHAEQGDSV